MLAKTFVARRPALKLRLILVLLSAVALLAYASTATAAGAEQFSGIGYFDDTEACNEDVEGTNGQAPDFALIMTGGLSGCLYTFVESSSCTPSGVYIETGTELFVGDGTSNNDGTFRTTYRFQAKFEDCANVSGQLFGGCQHPIVSGSGTGDYEGVEGRFRIKDNVETGELIYRGHLRF